MKKLFVITLIFVCTTTAANGQEVRVGAMVHDVGPIFGNDRIEGGADLNLEFIFGKGLIRQDVGVMINSEGHTSQVYGGVVIGMTESVLLAEIGIGVVFQMNSIRNLGGPVLFRISGELGFRFRRHSLSILWNHISNAGLADHNAGLDVLGLRYGYNF